MNWLRENRFLGRFLILFGLGTVGALWLLLAAKSRCDDATLHFNLTLAELQRLERLAPFPSDENLKTMKAQANDYAVALARVREELKRRVLPIVPMAPNEFQSHLRRAMTAATDKARANKIKLPDRFYLGFDEFASALPSEAAAPFLGQELTQVEWFLNTLFEARVDALTFFRRAPLSEEHGNALALLRSKANLQQAVTVGGPRLLERNAVEATFVCTPSVARKVLNRIAGANEQLFIVRLLHVRNEKDKGPLRAVNEDGVSAATPSPAPVALPKTLPATAPSLKFVVGEERLEISARIEIVRATF